MCDDRSVLGANFKALQLHMEPDWLGNFLHVKGEVRADKQA